MKKIILFFVLIILAFKVAGQELIFQQSVLNSRLPSEECYSIIQDPKGYLWIATEEGFCKYSKGKIEVFNKKNGLPEKAVYASAIGPDNKLYIGTSTNRYLKYDGSKFTELSFQNYLKLSANKIFANVNYPLHIYFTRDNIYLQEVLATTVYNRVKKKFKRFELTNRNSLIYKKDGDLPLICLSSGALAGNFKKTIDDIIITQDNKRDIVYKINIPDVPIINIFSHAVRIGTNNIISFDKYIVILRSDGKAVKKRFSRRVLSMKADKHGGLWVGLLKGGILYFPDASNLDYTIQSLKAYSVTGICEDTENAIWCSTLEKGVFYCLNKNLFDFTRPEFNKKGTLLMKKGKYVYFSSAATRLIRFDNLGNQLVKNYKFPEYAQFNTIAFKNDRFLIGGSDCIRFFDKNLNFKGRVVNKKDKSNTPISSYSIADSGNNFYITGYATVSKLVPNSFSINIITTLKEGPARRILNLNDKFLLVGGKAFLKIIDLRDNSEFNVKGIKSEVTTILKSSTDKIFITTRDNGIYAFDINTKTITRLKVKLPTDILYDVIEDDSGRLWIASNAGLLKLTKTNGDYTCAVYSTKHGLPSNVVTKVASLGKMLYFTTNEGLFSFNTGIDFYCYTNQNIYLTSVSVNDKLTLPKNNKLILDYDKNNLQLNFDVPAFKPGVVVKYEFYNTENSRSTEILNGNELNLTNLNPGNYTLVIRIFNNDGFEKSYPLKFYIFIKPPFWKTGWFFLLVTLLIIGLIILTAVLIVKRIKRQEEKKTKTNQLLAQYQMSALQAQMNPHFIFNAINTIQGYILGQNKDEAYNYLTQFSKLIRMVLHHSQEKNVLLEDELEMLKLYIELEQLRFDHCFDVIFDIDPEVEIHEALMPSMVLQPFIENAIWHGIINLKKSRQGLLTIKLTQTENVLQITIKDNGVGREQAALYKTSSHKSVALSVTSQRIKMLNNQFGNIESGLIISDIYDENGNPYGTKVEIQLPLQFH